MVPLETVGSQNKDGTARRPSLFAFRPLPVPQACRTRFLDERLLLFSGHLVNLPEPEFAVLGVLGLAAFWIRRGWC